MMTIENKKETIMKCPECSEEMVEVLPAQVQLQPLQKEEEIYPSKIVCMLYHIYQCSKCGIKASKPESKDYLAKELTNCNDKGCQGCTECEEHK